MLWLARLFNSIRLFVVIPIALRPAADTQQRPLVGSLRWRADVRAGHQHWRHLAMMPVDTVIAQRFALPRKPVAALHWRIAFLMKSMFHATFVISYLVWIN